MCLSCPWSLDDVDVVGVSSSVNGNVGIDKSKWGFLEVIANDHIQDVLEIDAVSAVLEDVDHVLDWIRLISEVNVFVSIRLPCFL